eukprot:6188119-Pleurochrysis_carterae.AAC.1
MPAPVRRWAGGVRETEVCWRSASGKQTGRCWARAASAGARWPRRAVRVMQRRESGCGAKRVPPA